MKKLHAHHAILLLILLIGVAGPGCQIDRVRKENDRLRSENLHLRSDLEESQGRTIALQQQLGRLRAEAGLPDTDPTRPDITDIEPVVTKIAVDRLSHAVDLDRDGLADQLIVYINPRDGRGRFVQLAGRLSISITWIDEHGGAEPLSQMSLTPVGVSNAYRSSFMGTYYRVDVPISARIEHEVVLGWVVYVDGRSGQKVQADHSFDLTRPRPQRGEQ